MSGRSHAKCRNCGRARHLKVRSNLCGHCYAELHQPAVKEGWRQVKARRRARQLAALGTPHPQPQEEIVELLTESPPEPATNGVVRRPLNDDQELELVDLYTKQDWTAQRLAERFHVPSTYPYKVLERLGITWRQNGDQTFEAWQEAQNPNLVKVQPPKAADEIRRNSDHRIAERIPADTRVEIVGLYDDPRVSTSLIAQAYHISAAVLLEIVKIAGVRMRNSQPDRFSRAALRQGIIQNGSFVENSAPEKRQLPPQIEAMRDVIVPSEPVVIVPAAVSEAIPVTLSPEPVQETRDLVFASDDGSQVWEVTFTGKMLVKANSVDEALQRARVDGHITTIVGVNLRSTR